jgi:hypothetical protein
MQRLEVSGAVRPLYGSLGVKGLRITALWIVSSRSSAKDCQVSHFLQCTGTETTPGQSMPTSVHCTDPQILTRCRYRCNVVRECTQGTKFVPDVETKIYWWSWGTAPLMLKLGTRCRSVFSLTRRPLFLRMSILVPVEQDYFCAPDSVSKFSKVKYPSSLLLKDKRTVHLP